jgi:hypothetical protein
MKSTILLAAIFSCLLLIFACNTSYKSKKSAGLVNNGAPTTAAVADGQDPPHAVDTDGKAIPAASKTEPAKPIILAKDSLDDKNGELKKEAAFDHTKHSTDPQYSIDGKTVVACVECHHTDQPKAPAGQEYLKEFERKEVLTKENLSKEGDVKTCRACHFQAATEPTEKYPPDSISYPKGSGKSATKDKITNEEAYHLNCNSCHDAARKRTPKSPSACADCHVQKG